MLAHHDIAAETGLWDTYADSAFRHRPGGVFAFSRPHSADTGGRHERVMSGWCAV
ncbi:hypothetical protein [Streptomyces cyaneofuscatus]|uniref:hypothetical protein n=1 Tax=Streptomyces cyaneofuscatus TaxID=66883 RepID=UPI003417E5D8